MQPSRRFWPDWILAFLFFIFAAVQWNDPDGWIWMLLYGGVALLCLFWKQLALGIHHILLIVFLLYFLSYIPSLLQWVSDGMPSVVASMQAESPYIEIIREAGGVFICLLVVFYYRMQRKKTTA